MQNYVNFPSRRCEYWVNLTSRREYGVFESLCWEGSKMERNLTSDERSQVKAKEEAAAKIREEKVKKEARGASALAKVF